MGVPYCFNASIDRGFISLQILITPPQRKNKAIQFRSIYKGLDSKFHLSSSDIK